MLSVVFSTFICEEVIQANGSLQAGEAALVPAQVFVGGVGDGQPGSALIPCTSQRGRRHKRKAGSVWRGMPGQAKYLLVTSDRTVPSLLQVRVWRDQVAVNWHHRHRL